MAYRLTLTGLLLGLFVGCSSSDSTPSQPSDGAMMPTTFRGGNVEPSAMMGGRTETPDSSEANNSMTGGTQNMVGGQASAGGNPGEPTAGTMNSGLPNMSMGGQGEAPPTAGQPMPPVGGAQMPPMPPLACGASPYTLGQVISGTLNGAADRFPLACNGGPSGEAIFALTVDAAGTICVSTQGSEFDTVLGGWRGECGAMSVGCNDDENDGYQSTSDLEFRAEPGFVYYISIEGFDGEIGRYRLTSTAGRCAGAQLPACDDETDCPEGQACVLGQCGDAPGALCMQDADCAMGETCRDDGFCIMADICGNNILEGEEECDDGNQLPQDGCSPDCIAEALPNEGQLRVLDGQNARSGRIEIWHNGAWGAVCDDDWDVNDAEVACRQLGFRGALDQQEQRAGNVNYVISDLECTGEEPTLLECPGAAFGDPFCFGAEGAGVTCLLEDQCRLKRHCGQGQTCGLNNTCVVADVCGNGALENEEVCDDGNAVDGDGCSAQCTREDGAILEGDVRITGNMTPGQGRVEIYQDGSWQPICDDDWGLADARVACRQAGFGPARDASTNLESPDGAEYAISNLSCRGDERRLADCTSAEPGFLCFRQDAAGAVCAPLGGCATDDDCNGEQVCNQAFQCVEPRRCGNGIKDANEQCDDGNNESGDGCAVNCSREPGFITDGDLRISDGANERTGRIDMYWQGAWYGVCDDEWGQDDADVACRQLGYSGAADVLRQLPVGPEDFILDNVDCDGDELNLLACGNNGLFDENCGGREGAGVQCTNEPRCAANADCPANTVCIEGRCDLPPIEGCVVDAMCAAGEVCIDFVCMPPPQCVPAEHAIGTISQANTNSGVPFNRPGCGISNSFDVAFEFTVPQTGPVCLSTVGSRIDTIISVREGCEGPEVACNDNSILAGGFQSAVEVNAQANTQYVVFIDGFRRARGAVQLSSLYGPCQRDQTPPACRDDAQCRDNGNCVDNVCVNPNPVPDPDPNPNPDPDPDPNPPEMIDSPAVGEIVISEIMYNPDGLDDEAAEWVELYNGSQERLRLDGCTLGESIPGRELSLDGITMEPGTTVLFARSANPAMNGGLTPLRIYGLELNNGGGDTVTLLCGAEVIDQVDYGNNDRFPNANGKSLSRSGDNLFGRDGPNVRWCLGREIYIANPQNRGTPDAKNPDCP